MDTTFSDRFKGFTASLADITRLNLSETEKLLNMQRDSLAFYQQVGLQQIHGLADIGQKDGLKQVLSRGVYAMGDVARRQLDDAKALMQSATAYRASLADIVRSKAG